MERYSRHMVLDEVGPQGQQKLSLAKVLVVGAGGLGCPVLQYLAASGIGSLGIIDFDVVETSNLQRQVLFGTQSLGMNKALAAKERLLDLNPTITVVAYPEKLTSANILTIAKEYEIIVDGSDNFATRYLINDAAVLLGLPVVYGSIYKFEGQVSVFNYQNGPSYRCLFPTPPKQDSVPNCSEVGVLGVLTGIIGTLQANEVLKIVLDLGTSLSGKLLCYNSKTNVFTQLTIPRIPAEIEKVKSDTLQENEEAVFCSNNSLEISAKNALEMKEVVFLDVREPHERPKIQHPNAMHIPLRELEHHLQTIPSEKTIACFCQSGIRSITAVQLLQKNNISKCYSIQGGVFELTKVL
ncbi:MAG: HesA/MoeB/ThiF family protein [Flavobacteriaceae bacterium]